jgi:2'-5' RNA ligase
VGSTSLLAARASRLRDHWAVWRPEWTAERTCLYWYLTFTEDQLSQVVDEQTRAVVDGTDWLDPVPGAWSHVTVCDVGFAEDLDQADVEAVTSAVADAMTGEERLRLTLGPVEAFASAVVLAAAPIGRLRAVRDGVRRATSAALGDRHTDVHRRLFWPHLSLGYVNREVETGSVDHFFRELPPSAQGPGGDAGQVEVDALTLAAVTRRDQSYRWEVRAQVDLV